MNDLVFAQNGQVLTNSLTISNVFDKRHDDILKAVRNLDCPADFKLRNFAELVGTYKNGIGVECKRPVFNITKDGFVLLVMGFTGKKAMEFKIKYIEAFNAMEHALAAAPALDAKAIGGIVKKCCTKAVREELGNLSVSCYPSLITDDDFLNKKEWTFIQISALCTQIDGNLCKIEKTAPDFFRRMRHFTRIVRQTVARSYSLSAETMFSLDGVLNALRASDVKDKDRIGQSIRNAVHINTAVLNSPVELY